jgi:hypothetical protein
MLDCGYRIDLMCREMLVFSCTGCYRIQSKALNYKALVVIESCIWLSIRWNSCIALEWSSKSIFENPVLFGLYLGCRNKCGAGPFGIL